MFKSVADRIASRGVVFNGYCSIADAGATEIFAGQGWDFVTIDMQHGPFDVARAVSSIRAAELAGAGCLVRLPGNDPALAMKLLDAGAHGVVCPMIEGRQAAENLVSACRYPPDGVRSYGPFRALQSYGADYVEHANTSVSVIGMVETGNGIANIENIVDAVGLDGVYVGPKDLQMSLGAGPGGHGTNSCFEDALEKVVSACARRKIFAGISVSTPAEAARRIGQGFRFITLGTDARCLASHAAELVRSARATIR